MIDGEKVEHTTPRIVGVNLHYASPLGGLVWHLRSLLDEVREGDPIFEIRNYFGETAGVVRCPFARGLMLARRVHPAVNSGDMLGGISELLDQRLTDP